MVGKAGKHWLSNIPASKQSTERVFVRFHNNTARKVDIFWITHNRKLLKYKTLGTQEFVDVNTYKGHHWVFFDADNFDELVVKGRPIYSARSNTTARILIPITLPIDSLKSLALLQCRRSIKYCYNIDKLDIPVSLKKELKTAIHIKMKLQREITRTMRGH